MASLYLLFMENIKSSEKKKKKSKISAPTWNDEIE